MAMSMAMDMSTQSEGEGGQYLGIPLDSILQEIGSDYTSQSLISQVAFSLRFIDNYHVEKIFSWPPSANN